MTTTIAKKPSQITVVLKESTTAIMKNFMAFMLFGTLSFIACLIGMRTALVNKYGEPLEYRSGSLEEISIVSVSGALQALLITWACFFTIKALIDIRKRTKQALSN